MNLIRVMPAEGVDARLAVFFPVFIPGLGENDYDRDERID